MDPLSVVGSTVGVLSLCLQATKTTFNIIEGLKRPHKSHQELLQVLTELRVVLQATETIFSTEQVLSSPRSSPLLDRLNSIGKILVTVTQTLSKAPSTGRVAALRGRTGILRNIDKDIKQLEEAVAALQMILSQLNLAGTAVLNQDIKRQRDELESLLSLQQGTSESVASSLRSLNADIGSLVQKSATRQSPRTTGLSDRTIDELSQLDYESKHFFHKGQRPKGGGLWILSQTVYMQWLNGKRLVGLQNWLWLSGGPGSGKTTLTSIIIDDLFLRFNTDATIAVAMFYFDYTAEVTIQEVALAVIKQLCSRLPQSVSLPVEVLEVHQFMCLGRTPTLGTLTDTLARVCSKFSRAYIVFDGLDEFTGEGLDSFLLMLKDVPCKLFAASRPVPSFQRHFNSSLQIRTHVDEHDISMYTSQMIQDHPDIRSLLDERLLEEINQFFLENSTNTFLFTVLQMQHILEQTSTWEIRQCLEESPRTLEDLYRRSIERLLLQSPSRSRLARRTLIWLAYQKRPLAIKELQHALAITSKDIQIDADRISPQTIIEGACFTLVSVDPRSSIVLLSHFSLQNYLGHHRSELFQGSFQPDMLARTCFDYLDLEIFKNGPCQSSSELEERLSAHPFARYAAVHWGDHLRELESQDILSNSVDSLLQPTSRALAVVQIHLAEMQLLLFEPDVLQTFSSLHLTSFFGLIGKTVDLLRGLNPSPLDPFGRTPLHWAVERKHTELVEILLHRGANQSVLDRDSANVLHLASRGAPIPILESLLARCEKQDLVARDNRDQTPLQLAATYSTSHGVEMIVQLMRTLDIDTALFQAGLDCAVLNGRLEIVQSLLESGAAKPLEVRLAAKYGFEDIVKVLFDYGVDIEAVDAHGVAAIHEASATGKLEMIHFLLDNGADITLADHDGRTPIFYAVNSSNRVTVELLLRQGADANSMDRTGRTVLSTAIEASDIEMVQLLLQYGVDCDSPVFTGHAIPQLISSVRPVNSSLGSTGIELTHRMNPLSLAAYHGDKDIVKALIDSGATLIGQRNVGGNAIHFAAYENHSEIVQLLAYAGQDIDGRDENGLTALHYAAATGSVDTMKTLLECGANPNARNSEQLTPASLAAKSKHKFAVDLLLHMGAAEPEVATISTKTSDQLETRAGHLERKSTSTAVLRLPIFESAIYVGIHYETNYLQACFATQDNLKKINMIQWPGQDPEFGFHRTSSFLPTRIAYADENEGEATTKWGNDVLPSHKSYHCSPAIIYPSNYLIMSVDPAERTRKTMCSDFLHQVCNFLVEELNRQYSAAMIEASQIMFCFTVDTTWAPAMLQDFLTLVKTAGFGGRANDHCVVVPASEAASLAVLSQLDTDVVEPIKDGECFTVCQCGDLTVDVVTYTLMSRQPTLQFQEACIGDGKPCGFALVQSGFQDWMTQTFGLAYTSLPKERIDLGSEFTQHFERLKFDFDIGRRFYEIPLLMDAPSSNQYQSEDGIVILRREDLRSLFDPSIGKIAELIQEQLNDAASMNNRKPQNVYLTGSFASSRYLQDCLRLAFNSQGIRILTPLRSADAAVIGAVLYAFANHSQSATRIARRVSRYHYGFSSVAPFRHGIDDVCYRFWDHLAGMFMCHRMTWFLTRGDSLETKSKYRFPFSAPVDKAEENVPLRRSLRVYRSASNHPPLYWSDSETTLVKELEYKVLPSIVRRLRSIASEKAYTLQFTLEVEILEDKNEMRCSVVPD